EPRTKLRIWLSPPSSVTGPSCATTSRRVRCWWITPPRGSLSASGMREIASGNCARARVNCGRTSWRAGVTPDARSNVCYPSRGHLLSRLPSNLQLQEQRAETAHRIESIVMKVAILGLGYVGTVAGACLAGRGHQVVGVDIDPGKIDLMNQGRPSFVEPQLAELMAEAKQKRLLSASTEAASVIAEADVVIVTVGTPTGARGKPDL